MNLDNILTDAVFKAIQAKQKTKHEDAGRMGVGVIMPGGEVVEMPPLAFRDPAQKRAVMHALALILARIGAEAVVLSADTRSLDAKAFAARFGIAPPRAEDNGEAFLADYDRIMAAHGRDMGSLPSDCWEDALCVSIKGKGVARMALTRYTARPDGTYVFEPTEYEAGNVEIGMLPDWWA
jgi:hypothetical protein